jgi:CrcB protein
MTVLLVALAGSVGVLARYGLSAPLSGAALLWATCAINVAGSFALGLLIGSDRFADDTRAVLGTGFLGGFTTFSTFSLQAVLEADDGHAGRALIYVLASVLLGIAAAAGGYALART